MIKWHWMQWRWKKGYFSTLLSFNLTCIWLRKLEILRSWTHCPTLVPSQGFEPRMKEILSTKDCLKGHDKMTVDAVSMKKKGDLPTLFFFNLMCMLLRKLEILTFWTHCLTLVPSQGFKPRMKEILSTKDCLKGHDKMTLDVVSMKKKWFFHSLLFQSNVYVVKEARNSYILNPLSNVSSITGIRTQD